MKIGNTIALVTGANRGIGLAFTRELLARGARKVYAGARDPSAIKHLGVEAIRLDVTKPDEIMAAAAHAGDVALLINNAGVGYQGGFLARDSEEVQSADMCRPKPVRSPRRPGYAGHVGGGLCARDRSGGLPHARKSLGEHASGVIAWTDLLDADRQLRPRRPRISSSTSGAKVSGSTPVSFS